MSTIGPRALVFRDRRIFSDGVAAKHQALGSQPASQFATKGGSVKHKGERHIPDFSKKPKTGPAINPDRKPVAPPGRAPQPKPQSTSSKSGRRGQ
jgi:hypothetical protein